MIQISDISKTFKGKEEPVLTGISTQIPDGSVYGLIGCNGAGKTTLLKIIAGICRPDAGQITIDGQPVYENSAVKSRIFLMTEEVYWLPQASLRKMERFYAGYYARWDGRVFSELTHLFELPEDRPVAGFSKGMQRQAALCAAFASGADLLLLDEAFDGLDLGIRRTMRSLLRYYVQPGHASAIITSHNLEEIEACADRFGMIDGGVMSRDMDLSSVRERGESLEELFLRNRNEEYDWDTIFKKNEKA